MVPALRRLRTVAATGGLLGAALLGSAGAAWAGDGGSCRDLLGSVTCFCDSGTRPSTWDMIRRAVLLRGQAQAWRDPLRRRSAERPLLTAGTCEWRR
jgi:hypothetical protein